MHVSHRNKRRRKAALVALSLSVPLSHAHAASAAKAMRAPIVLPGIDATAEATIEREAQRTGLSLPVLHAALNAYRDAAGSGLVKRAVLTVIDYSLPSRMPRLWVLDLVRGAVLAHELVAHGRGSGEDLAFRFSNAMASLQSSLGAFVTTDTYEGHNGLSLRLQGLNPGLNDHAMARGIVMHGAQYVSEETIRALGRLGRSEGCPAVSQAAAPRIIDMIRGGSVLFAYYPAPALRRIVHAE